MDVDTIVALSTPPGVGAIAVVRMSGPASFSILRRIAPDLAADLDALAPARISTFTRLVSAEDREMIDHALVTRFPGPASYTGEDVVEISCHGGVLVSSLVVEACRGCGARPAEPGEFTRRAYLRGRLDLVQAEAVADLIHARSRALHRASVAQLDRGLSERVGSLRQGLLALEASLAHHVDFPEEDDPPVPLDRIRQEGEALAERVAALLATAPEGEMLREGALVVLAGRPNVGKSSLYNALLGRERAIVTSVAGTTRDALEADVELGGFPFRLVDTAGLRETDAEVERKGIEVTHRYLEAADVVLFCVEAGSYRDPDEETFLRRMEGRVCILVETKGDRVQGAADAGVGMGVPGPAGWDAEGELVSPGRSGEASAPGDVVGDHPGVTAAVRVSARSGEGLATLRALLPRLAYSGLVQRETEVPVITRRRHAVALEEARECIRAFCLALDALVPVEIASAHLRSAESALEDLLGLISTEDVLDVVFRDFCVGK